MQIQWTVFPFCFNFAGLRGKNSHWDRLTPSVVALNSFPFRIGRGSYSLYCETKTLHLLSFVGNYPRWRLQYSPTDDWHEGEGGGH